jgi:hypothetical protein
MCEQVVFLNRPLLVGLQAGAVAVRILVIVRARTSREHTTIKGQSEQDVESGNPSRKALRRAKRFTVRSSRLKRTMQREQKSTLSWTHDR